MPLPRSVDQVDRRLMRDKVYVTIRDWIVQGVLAPDEVIRDVELAHRLGVSRTPLREALRRLEDEGLVHTSRNRWTRVTPINKEEAFRLYPIIWSLEPLAIKSGIEHLSTRDINEMRDLNVELRDALKHRNPVAASEADAQFHRIFIARSGNTHLIRILDDIKTKLRRIEIAYFDGSIVAGRSVSEHEAILRALRHRDAEAARAAIVSNWRNSLDRLSNSLETPATSMRARDDDLPVGLTSPRTNE